MRLSRTNLVASFVLAGFLALTAQGYAAPPAAFATHCAKCHKDGGKKDVTTLVKAAPKHDAKWFTGWLKGTQANEAGKKHKAVDCGADTKALADWLATLK